MHRLAGFLAALGLASGCASVGSFQTADTVGYNRLEVALEPAFYGAYSAERRSSAVSFNLRGAFGVTEQLDVGARLGGTGLELTSKLRLTPPWQEGFVLAVAPSAGGFVLPEAAGFYGTGFLNLPVLLGFGWGGHQLVLGPRLQGWLLFGSGGVAHALSAGASLGVSIKVRRGLRLLPEVTGLHPILGSPELSSARRTYLGGGVTWVLQAGVAVLWNG